MRRMTQDQIIYGDESGWTGPDLLTTEQPILATATVRLDPRKALELVRQFFGSFDTNEIKFRECVKTHAGQQSILEFTKWVATNPRRQRSYVMHKRFVVLAKIVDVLVENAAYRGGRDLYADGGHVQLMNSIHTLFPSFAGENNYVELLRRFQTLARKPTQSALDSFFDFVNGPWSTEANAVLAPLKRVRKTTSNDTLLRDLKDAELDVLGTSLYAIAFSWNAATPKTKLRLVFDEQSKLRTETNMWSTLQDPDFHPPGINRAPVVDFVDFGNSQTYSGIQLADILAGSLRFVYTARNNVLDDSQKNLGFLHELSAIVTKMPILNILPGVGYSKSNQLINYNRAQQLIDTTMSALHRQKERGK